MFSTILVGLLGYYAGLYSSLWFFFYPKTPLIKDKFVYDNKLKYKEL